MIWITAKGRDHYLALANPNYKPFTSRSAFDVTILHIEVE